VPDGRLLSSGRAARRIKKAGSIMVMVRGKVPVLLGRRARRGGRQSR
jgi:hypothetical protein